MKNMKERNPAAYKKYLEKYDPDAPANIKARKQKAIDKRKKWWSENWIALSGVVVALISLAVSVTALLV